MKIIRQPVDMIAWFNAMGVIMPLKFRLESENHTLQTIKINEILYHTEDKFAGNFIRTYACTINLNGIEKPCELRYDLNSCKWSLFKI